MTQEDCPICFDSLRTEGSQGSEEYKARCGHSFHKPCIDKWIDSFHWRCPLCRERMVEIELKGRKNPDDPNIIEFKFNGETYDVNADDIGTVAKQADIGYSQTDREYNLMKLAIIVFSIVKTSTLEEATEKAKNFISGMHNN